MTEPYRVVQPLEVILEDRAEEEKYTLMSWDVLQSTEDMTSIQINFKEADSFAPIADTLDLTITFWGVDMFKS